MGDWPGMSWGVGAASVWLIVALVLGIAELAVPGVFLIFLAIAAAITGVATFALAGLPAAAQLASFAVWSVVSVLIGRRWYREYEIPAADPLLNDRAARLVGAIVEVQTPIEQGEGRVRLGDGAWPARGPNAAIGMRLRVIAVENGTLLVETIDPPIHSG